MITEETGGVESSHGPISPAVSTFLKVIEEGDMWKARDQERDGNSFSSRMRSSVIQKSWGGPPRWRSRSRSPTRDSRMRSRVDEVPKAHMDREPKETYWQKQLLAAEENDPDRWGHSGFQELYPEFSGDGQEDDGASERKDKSKKHKKHKKLKKHHKKKEKKDKKRDQKEKKEKRDRKKDEETSSKKAKDVAKTDDSKSRSREKGEKKKDKERSNTKDERSRLGDRSRSGERPRSQDIMARSQGNMSRSQDNMSRSHDKMSRSHDNMSRSHDKMSRSKEERLNSNYDPRSMDRRSRTDNFGTRNNNELKSGGVLNSEIKRPDRRRSDGRRSPERWSRPDVMGSRSIDQRSQSGDQRSRPWERGLRQDSSSSRPERQLSRKENDIRPPDRPRPEGHSSRSNERRVARSDEQRMLKSKERPRSRSKECQRLKSNEHQTLRSEKPHRSRSNERHRSRSNERHRSRSNERHRLRSNERKKLTDDRDGKQRQESEQFKKTDVTRSNGSQLVAQSSRSDKPKAESEHPARPDERMNRQSDNTHAKVERHNSNREGHRRSRSRDKVRDRRHRSRERKGHEKGRRRSGHKTKEASPQPKKGIYYAGRQDRRPKFGSAKTGSVKSDSYGLRGKSDPKGGYVPKPTMIAAQDYDDELSDEEERLDVYEMIEKNIEVQNIPVPAIPERLSRGLNQEKMVESPADKSRKIADKEGDFDTTEVDITVGDADDGSSKNSSDLKLKQNVDISAESAKTEDLSNGSDVLNNLGKEDKVEMEKKVENFMAEIDTFYKSENLETGENVEPDSTVPSVKKRKYDSTSSSDSDSDSSSGSSSSSSSSDGRGKRSSLKKRIAKRRKRQSSSSSSSSGSDSSSGSSSGSSSSSGSDSSSSDSD